MLRPLSTETLTRPADGASHDGNIHSDVPALGVAKSYFVIHAQFN